MPYNFETDQGLKFSLMQNTGNRDWYQNKVKKISMGTFWRDHDAKLLKDLKIGKMYAWLYDATWKDKGLPYWDRFPLDFIVDMDAKYIHGINMHYLPLALRQQLMAQLYTIANRKVLDEKTKLRLSYGALMQMGNIWKPCYKKYIRTGIKSAFLEIPAWEWDEVLILENMSNFVSYKDGKYKTKNKQDVYKDSIKRIR